MTHCSRCSRDLAWTVPGLYYAGLRPGEAQQLRRTTCVLLDDGWGELLLTGSRTEVSAGYYAPRGARHHDRPLKRGSPEDVRPVPIPQALVEILREHLDVHRTEEEEGGIYVLPVSAVLSPDGDLACDW